LKQALSKDLSLTNLERLNQKEANRYVIYQTILERLPLCKNLDDLKNQLQKKGIETLYKYKGQTQELQQSNREVTRNSEQRITSRKFITGSYIKARKNE